MDGYSVNAILLTHQLRSEVDVDIWHFFYYDVLPRYIPHHQSQYVFNNIFNIVNRQIEDQVVDKIHNQILYDC